MAKETKGRSNLKAMDSSERDCPLVDTFVELQKAGIRERQSDKCIVTRLASRSADQHLNKNLVVAIWIWGGRPVPVEMKGEASPLAARMELESHSDDDEKERVWQAVATKWK